MFLIHFASDRFTPPPFLEEVYQLQWIMLDVLRARTTTTQSLTNRRWVSNSPSITIPPWLLIFLNTPSSFTAKSIGEIVSPCRSRLLIFTWYTLSRSRTSVVHPLLMSLMMPTYAGVFVWAVYQPRAKHSKHLSLLLILLSKMLYSS